MRVDFATPDSLIQEQSLGIHYNQERDLLDDLADAAEFDFHDGRIDRPPRPGLGIDIDERAVRHADMSAVPGHTPGWRLGDGAFAES